MSSYTSFPLGQYEVRQIPGGAAGTAATIEAMKQKALECSRHEPVIDLARWIVEDVDRKDHEGEVRALFDWVKEHCRYINDPVALELVSGACDMIFRVGQGDCDDHAIVMAALSMAIGRRAAFRTVAVDSTRPTQASHVYALIQVGKDRWLAADTAEGGYLGWEPPNASNPTDWLVL